MPNLAFHIEVLNQVIEKRAAQSDPIAIKLNNPANSQLKQFAVLGAMGPDIFRYMPVSKKLATFLSNFIPPATSGTALTQAEITAKTALIQTALSNLTTTDPTMAFELYFNPLGAIYSVLFSGLVVPVWPVLDKATDFFNLIEGLVQDQSNLNVIENLPGILDELPGVLNLAKGLTGLPSSIALMQVVIGSILTLGPWMEMNETFPSPTDATLDRRYEFLRWHKTSEFAQSLQKHATNDHQKAYTFGWLCHLSSSVTAEPFINNITGGPYRTHWWRNRLVGNFVDSWTFGFFEQPVTPTMAGDNPTPAYFNPTTGTGWPALCNGANLQNEFNVGNLSGPPADDVPASVKAVATGDLGTLPNQFPADINDLFTKALNETYPANQPIVGLGLPAFESDTFAKAYVGASAVYWFMTSGKGALGSNVVGPGTGMPEPGWISSGSTPSPSQAGLNVGAAICAVLLAILGALVTLGGDIPAGLAILGAALNQPIIDWATVANELFWLRKTLIDAENALQDALVMSGLAYPPPVMLGAQVNIQGIDETLPATDLTPPFNPDTVPVPNVTGIALCKSNSISNGANDVAGIKSAYPRQLDKTNTVGPFADINFAVYPLVRAEDPTTANLIPANLYPNKLVNGFGLQNGGIMANGPYPSNNLFFGDAVSNAVQLLKDGAGKLPSYNLDSDRGYGWKDWDPKIGSNPAIPPVLDVQEA